MSVKVYGAGGSVKFSGAGGGIRVLPPPGGDGGGGGGIGPLVTAAVPGFGDVTLEVMPFAGTTSFPFSVQDWPDTTSSRFVSGKWSAWCPLLRVSTDPGNFFAPPGFAIGFDGTPKYLTFETAQQAPVDQSGTSSGWTTPAGEFVPLTPIAYLSYQESGNWFAYSGGMSSYTGSPVYGVMCNYDLGGGRASPDTGITEPGAILPGQRYVLKVRVKAFAGLYPSDVLLGSVDVVLDAGVAPPAPV